MASEDKIIILMADDDEDDCFLAKEALKLSETPANLYSVKDGIELMDHLLKNKPPDIILLDLNMPCKDGREALNEIRIDPILCNIPIVILSTSELERDKSFTIEAGANLYISKPPTFDEWVQMMRDIVEFGSPNDKKNPGKGGL